MTRVCPCCLHSILYEVCGWKGTNDYPTEGRLIVIAWLFLEGYTWLPLFPPLPSPPLLQPFSPLLSPSMTLPFLPSFPSLPFPLPSPPLPSPPATLVVSLANLEGEESFDTSLLGSAEVVVQEMVCDDELILIKGYVDPLLTRFSRGSPHLPCTPTQPLDTRG